MDHPIPNTRRSSDEYSDSPSEDENQHPAELQHPSSLHYENVQNNITVGTHHHQPGDVEISPPHSPGHTPGHLVGRQLHDSPKQHHQQLHDLNPIHFHPAEETNITGTGLAIPQPPPVLKLLEAQRSGDTLVEGNLLREPGSEPGLDPRREAIHRAYAHIKEECEIEVIDYGAQNIKFRQYKNADFLDFLAKSDRTPSFKVRWINVAGISWDIISALALKYQLHPLSIEDILHSGATTRSKADYYSRHLFLHVLCHSLTTKRSSPLKPKYLQDDSGSSGEESESTEVEDDETDNEQEVIEEDNRRALLRRVTRRRGRRHRTKSSDTEAAQSTNTSRESRLRMPSLRWTEAMNLLSPEGRRRQTRIAKLEALKKRDRVRVLVSNAFFFLFRDGTVISIHQGDRSFGNQIYTRLRHADTVLRRDPDASMLLQSLLDLIVDQTLQVIEKYGDKINESETRVLLKPNMEVVRVLHILSADLTLRKRTMQPLKSLIYGLRRFDTERTIAACTVAGQPAPAQGYITPKTKVYLADISDHLETIMSSLDQFSTMTDNLIDFVFNMNSHTTNDQMKRMTILMIIFLPITALGMNFDRMPSVQTHSELFFWAIMLPVLAVIGPVAMWGEIVRVVRFIGRSRLLHRVQAKENTRAQRAQRVERRRRNTLEHQREENEKKRTKDEKAKDK
ncbi:hypothetical protein FRC17_001431 [Serendipita sp. 399]|nr:hypothetical protein FRC17_001431 [Serendipita sp. 399]